MKEKLNSKKTLNNVSVIIPHCGIIEHNEMQLKLTTNVS